MIQITSSVPTSPDSPNLAELTKRAKGCPYMGFRRFSGLCIDSTTSGISYPSVISEDLIVVFDAHYLMVDAVSLGLCRILGYKNPQEIQGKHLEDLINLDVEQKASLRDSPQYIFLPGIKLHHKNGKMVSNWTMHLFRVVTPTVVTYAAIITKWHTTPCLVFSSFVLDQRLRFKSGDLSVLDEDSRAFLKSTDLKEGTVYHTKLKEGQSLVVVCAQGGNRLCLIVCKEQESKSHPRIQGSLGKRSKSEGFIVETSRPFSQSSSEPNFTSLLMDMLEQPKGVILFDNENEIISANKKVLDALDYSIETLRYQCINEILSEESRQVMSDIVSRLKARDSRKAIETVEWEGMLTLIKSDLCPVKYRSKVVYGVPHSKNFALLIHQPKPKKKEKEEKIAEQDTDRQLRAIIANSADAIVIIGERGDPRIQQSCRNDVWICGF